MIKEPCCAKPVKGPKGDTGPAAAWENITGDINESVALNEAFAKISYVDAGLSQAQGNLTDAIAQEVIDRDAAIAADATAFSDITGAPSDNASLASALSDKANLLSPAFTGTPTAPTQAPGNNTTRLATTAFVLAAIAPRMTTTEKNALTPTEGDIVYDLTLHKLSYWDASNWVNP